jgi:hypothetical protein
MLIDYRCILLDLVDIKKTIFWHVGDMHCFYSFLVMFFIIIIGMLMIFMAAT